MTTIFQFFRDVRAELQKIVWPTRQETIRYTITVIIFSIVLAAVLGAADYGLLRGFESLLNR
jgi:preprotein translocase subunit SecE